jgi:hypothetical protein
VGCGDARSVDVGVWNGCGDGLGTKTVGDGLGTKTVGDGLGTNRLGDGLFAKGTPVVRVTSGRAEGVAFEPWPIPQAEAIADKAKLTGTRNLRFTVSGG